MFPAIGFCVVLVEEEGCTGDGVEFGLTVVDDAALGFATGRGLGRGRAVDMMEVDSVGRFCWLALWSLFHSIRKLLVNNVQKTQVKADPKG